MAETTKHKCEYRISVNIVIFKNCNLLELEIPDSYEKTYFDYISYRFF